MSNKNCLFFFFAFVPGLSTSFLTAAVDKDRCRDLGEVFCLKIHRFLVFCRSVYFGIVLDTPLLSPKGDTSAEKIKENRSCMSSLLPFVEVAKISQLRRINGRKDLPHVLGKSLQGRAERGGVESGAKRSVRSQSNGTKIYHPHFKDQPTGSSLFFSFDAENKNNIIAVSSTAKYQETKKSDQNKKVFYAAALTSALFERKGGGSKLLLSN